MMLKTKAAEIGCPRPVLATVVEMGAAGHGTASIADELDYSNERVRQIREELRELDAQHRALLLMEVGDKKVGQFFDRVCDPRGEKYER
jgi:hypothetical protein